MTPTSTVRAAVLTAVVCFGTAAITAAQTPERVTVPFSDPSRPGILRIGLVQGTITVTGTNRRDVVIEERTRDNSRGAQSGSRIIIGRGRGGGRGGGDNAGGLRRLAQPGSFEVVEENNQITVGTSNPNRAIDFSIEVPARTNLKLSTVDDGEIVVQGVEGELELDNTNGGIQATNVAGSVVANTTNGHVTVTLTRATPNRPMAFSSFNGNVDVTLPSSIRATLKLRSDGGDVYTDFDVQLQSTTATTQDTRRPGGRYKIEVNRSLSGTVNGGGPDIELRTYNGNIYVRKGN